MAAVIRLARDADAEQMLAIYAPAVRETAVSFELDLPTESEFRQRIADTLKYAPWLVCEAEGNILGYAYAGKYHVRAAYQWSVEISTYVHSRWRRQGIARGLSVSLLECLRLQGYYNAYACIALPNPASVALAKSLGFKPIGVLPSAGYKLGRWHDVGWWELALQEHSPFPHLPYGYRTFWRRWSGGKPSKRA